MCGVDFEYLETGFHGPSGGISEISDQLLNLGDIHRRRQWHTLPVSDRAWRQRLPSALDSGQESVPVPWTAVACFAASMGQLYPRYSAIAFDNFGHLCQPGNMRIFPYPQVIG